MTHAIGRKLVVCLLFLGVMLPAPGNATSAPTCQHTIGLEVKTADGNGNYAAIEPGDIVCVEAGDRGPLQLKNFRGAPGSPIVFINAGGVVTITNDGYAGIYVTNSQHIRITGAGVASRCGALAHPDEQQCGITIYGGDGRGIAGREKTSNIEIDHVEIAGAGQPGIAIQTKDISRDEWTQYNTSVRHTYVHDVPDDEGMYLGSSYYPTRNDPVLKGVEVSHNLVTNTGRDGIQVGSAVENCNIHHNEVSRSSLKVEDDQIAGIMNNKGSACHIFNNLIVDSSGVGIYVYGNGGNQVYHNVVARSGRLVSAGSKHGAGIVLSTSNPTDQSISVWSNTIIDSNGDGIRFVSNYGADNRIQNNVILNPAGDYIRIASDARITVSQNLGFPESLMRVLIGRAPASAQP